MRNSLLIWLACSVVGGAIVALPDTGPRLFSLSRAHGPSLVDAIGAVILIVGWLVFVAAVWQRRDRLARVAGTASFALAVFTLGLGVGLVIASVAGDYPYWWVVGAALLLGVQLLAAYLTAS